MSVSPAAELRAAAALLRERAEKAPKGPWTVERYYWKPRSEAIPDQWMVGVNDSNGDELARTSEQGDDETYVAADRMGWIAMMSPVVAVPLAKLLEQTAHLVQFAYNMEGERATEWILSAEQISALTFARAVTKAATP